MQLRKMSGSRLSRFPRDMKRWLLRCHYVAYFDDFYTDDTSMKYHLPRFTGFADYDISSIRAYRQRRRDDMVRK